MASTSTQTVSADFFARVPATAMIVFHAAVFFTFAPVGILFASSIEPSRSALAVTTIVLVSGLLSACWAATFTVSRWFALPLVLLNILMIGLNTIWRDTRFGLSDARFSLASLGVIAAIVVGYVLFIVFISGQGKQTVRLMTEMSLARNIHDTLVPPLHFRNDSIEALGLSSPSTEMGGDLIDIAEREKTTDLFLADVAGHGVRAGVVMGMVKSAIRMGLVKHENLSELLAKLNDVLESTTSSELYATFAVLRIAPGGRAEYALAGHHHIAHYRAASGTLSRLGDRSFPLGLFPGRDYATRDLDLEPGDLLALYTDGLNETADGDDEELGHEAIEDKLKELAGRPLEEIRRSVFDLAEQHGEQEDDRTLLLVRYGEPTSRSTAGKM